jgi:hypothetical protein
MGLSAKEEKGSFIDDMNYVMLSRTLKRAKKKCMKVTNIERG